MATEHSNPIQGGITACILTGGRGSRLGGVDKGLIKISERYLIEYSIEKIRPQVDKILISANRNIETYSSLCDLVVSDSFGVFEGPLAGFLAGMEKTETNYLATVPCDVPLLPDNLIHLLLTPIVEGIAEASVARVAGKLQPTFSCIPISQITSLRNYLDSGERRIISWLETLSLAKIDFDQDREFTNVNTPEDVTIVTKYLSRR